MMARIKRPSLDKTFAELARCAAGGLRCPASTGPQENRMTPSANITALARAGRIRVDIYPRNWRVVTILEGEHRGKTTAPCPKPGARPYRTIDANSTPIPATPPFRRPASAQPQPPTRLRWSARISSIAAELSASNVFVERFSTRTAAVI